MTEQIYTDKEILADALTARRRQQITIMHLQMNVCTTV